MSTVEPFVSVNQAEWIEKIKATDKLWVIGDEGGMYTVLDPMFLLCLSLSRRSPQLINKFIEIFNEFNQIKNEEWISFKRPVRYIC